jgi:hypothetical protein
MSREEKIAAAKAKAEAIKAQRAAAGTPAPGAALLDPRRRHRSPEARRLPPVLSRRKLPGRARGRRRTTPAASRWWPHKTPRFRRSERLLNAWSYGASRARTRTFASFSTHAQSLTGKNRAYMRAIWLLDTGDTDETWLHASQVIDYNSHGMILQSRFRILHPMGQRGRNRPLWNRHPSCTYLGSTSRDSM